MASVSPPIFPSHSPRQRNSPLLANPKLHSTPPLKKSPVPLYLPIFSHSHRRVSDSVLCYSRVPSDSSPSSEDNGVERGWNSQLKDVLRSVVKRIEDYLNSGRDESEDVDSERKKQMQAKGDEEWDWERWNKHFREIDEQEKLISVLKSQIGSAVYKEEYEYASKLKVAVAAAATNDVVGRVVSHFNRAVLEERYQDAAFFRDCAGTGLMGWWAGISEDLDDPYGRIIHIGVEHGRYVARSFSPRHLATAVPGVPLFEIFVTMSSKGEYKQKAVYLKRTGGKFDSTNSSKLLDPSSNISLNKTTELEKERSDTSSEDRVDDSDVAEELDGVENILRDMIPSDIRVVKVTAPDKVTKDFISNLIGQIVDEEDEEVEDENDDDDDGDDDDEDDDTDDDDDDKVQENDAELEIVLETNDDDAKDENHEDDETGIDVGSGDGGKGEDHNEITVEVVIGGHLPKLSSKKHAKTFLRVPAKLEKKDRLSFSFSVEEDKKQLEVGKDSVSADKSAYMQGQRSINNVMSDLAKFAINREKIPTQVLKDVEELINLTLNQAKRRQPLSGTTTFKRIEIPASADILDGLYIGAHGFHTSEVIHLSRKFGQWKEDAMKQKSSNLEFYEYVEALKLTGDPRVPAGQVAFRAKVGKQYQLPHKGIIPEEFGVVARYKGQGRLAEPGFKNPRWVDGELVVLDGKYIKGGPVVGFVYWAPDYHFLVFFNRLRLPE